MECERSGDTRNIRLWFDNTKSTTDTVVIAIDMAASNPCFRGSPNIDVDGEFRINIKQRTVAFDGKVEPFPAFEAYVSFGNVTKTLFTRGPVPGATPVDLFGNPNRPVFGVQAFPSDF